MKRQSSLDGKRERQVSETNVLLIGSGGREHALAWKLAASPLIGRLYAAPGNPGIARHGICVPIDTGDHEAVIAFSREKSIDLVVIGPEIPLVAGLVDDLMAAGIRAFGPSRVAAQLEGSKGFTKALCAARAIPTAPYVQVRSRAEPSATAPACPKQAGQPQRTAVDCLFRPRIRIGCYARSASTGPCRCDRR